MTADLALAADPGFLERSADPAEFVIQACERAGAWLREVLDHGDIDQIAEVKSQAEAVRVYATQKQLGKDAQLSATEIVRRAERGIGVAIRKGQEAGEIRRKGRPDEIDNGSTNSSQSSPGDYAGYGQARADIYAMTDGVSDEVFEEALAEAKAEGNLSRTNVAGKTRGKTQGKARKGPPSEWIPEPGDNHGEAPVQRRRLIRAWAEQGYSSRQMSKRLGMRDDGIRKIAREMGVEITADQIVGGTHRHDSSRIVRETVHSLEGLVMGLELVDLDQLDQAEAAEWVDSLTDSTRKLNRFVRQLRETTR